jgi:hypothetical protein
VTKEHLWEFPERQGFKRCPVEIYGEMGLLRLLKQFFDRALCFSDRGVSAVHPVAELIERLMLSSPVAGSSID